VVAHSKGDTVSVSIPRDFHELLLKLAPRLPIRPVDGRRAHSTATTIVWLAKRGLKAIQAENPGLDVYSD
jgi:hypothetical protein